MAKLKTTTDSNRKINGNTFLLIITIALFAIMYIAGMVPMPVCWLLQLVRLSL